MYPINRFSLALALFALCTAIGLALPLPVQAQEFGEETEGCTQNRADCRGVFVLPGYVRLFQTFVPIKDTPEARAEYQKLLPPGFEMPEDPGFKYTFNDAHVGTELMEVDRAVALLASLGGQAPAGTAWRETGVLITAAYTGDDGIKREGTYEIGFSTDGLVGYLGRPSYPKYYADITFQSELPTAVPNAIASLARLAGPGETWTSASYVAGPTTAGVSEITQQGTFVPVEGMELPDYYANFKPLDWRLDASPQDGGGTHQGPLVRQNEVLYAEPVPLSYLVGRSLGPLAVAGVTAPDIRVGMVHLKLDGRFFRFDEQSPEPMPDEVWYDVDLSKMIDLEGTYPGIMQDGQQVLRANPEIIAGRGGCASNGTCREPLQYRPENTDRGPAFTNFLFPGVTDGTACVAYSAAAGVRNSCQFTTRQPDGSPFTGIVSATNGAFELRANESSCRIWLVQNNGRIFSVGNGIVQNIDGRDTFRTSGYGAGFIQLDDRCTYTLTVDQNGSGPVYAGQSHGTGETPEDGSDTDGDGVPNLADNCPAIANSDQTDSNRDGAGDACQARHDAPALAELPLVNPELMPGCAPPIAEGGEWPSYGHDLANTRSQPLETQINADNVGELTEHFVFNTQAYENVDGTPGEPFEGKFFNTPVVADGCMYNAVSSGTVFAVNADTGKLVWKTLVEDDKGYTHLSGTGPTIGSVTVDQARNRIFVLVTGEGDPNVDDGFAGSGDPYVAALDQATGAVIWRSNSITPQDDLTNPDHDDAKTYFLSSTVLYDNLVIATFGGSAGQPYYRGGFGIVDADTGEVLKITNLFTQEDYNNNMSGGTIWATGVVDTVNKKFFVGTGNPGASTREHPWTNAIIKVELDQSSPRFGEIIGSYKGDNDHYVPGSTRVIDDNPDHPCFDLAEQGRVAYPANTLPCAQLDLDFGASANLFYSPDGRLLVGEMQKSGTYHVAFADTMEPAWKALIGTPCFPCNAASSAVVDDEVFVVGAPPRTMFALEDGGYNWATPITANGIHYQSVSAANGVVYTFDANNLHGYDAETGVPVLRLGLTNGELTSPDQGQVEEVAGGNFSHPATAAVLNSDSSGIAVARNTLFVAGNTSIYALRLASAAGDDGDLDGDGEPNASDNCQGLANPDQTDNNGNGVGDACEGSQANTDDDLDDDGVPNNADQCPNTAAGASVDAEGCSDAQKAADRDGDGVNDSVDNCPLTPNPDQADSDGNGVGDACQAPPADERMGSFEQGCRAGAQDLPYPEALVEAACGTGFATFDEAQFAYCGQFEGMALVGALCQDTDGDGAWDGRDNCPAEPNADQADSDGDGTGDACDSSGPVDSDGDGFNDDVDACPTEPAPGSADGCPVVVDGDDDNDGVANSADQCPDTASGVAVDARGCEAGSGDLTVTLSANPTTADVTDGAQTVTFTADPTVGDADLSGELTYVYYFGDGTNSGETDQASIDHDYEAAGEYTATVVVHDENGNAASDSVQVTMTTTVTVIGEQNDVVAVLGITTNGTTAPVTATLDASGSQNKPDGARYTFTFGDGSTRETTNPTVTHVYSLPGNYAVSVTVTDPADADNTSTATGEVIVNAVQQTTAILSVSPSQATVNQTQVQFDASGSVAAPGEQITSYSYDYYGDGSVVETKAEATSSFVYTRTGNFQPIVTVNDSAQGSSQAKARVAVSPVAANPPTDTPDAPRAPAQAGGGSGSLGWLMLVALGVAGLRRRFV